MAQRRSLNRRRSKGGRRSSNISGFLNDDTNIIGTNDPQWYHTTIVRPSTSMNISNRQSAMLDPDSNINVSQISDTWYNNLSRSSNSNLLEKTAKKNQNDESSSNDENINVDITESESEQEYHKKRAGLRSKFNFNQSDKTNIFMKALEKTSETSNLLVSRGPENESTENESITRRKKRKVKSITNASSSANLINAPSKGNVSDSYESSTTDDITMMKKIRSKKFQTRKLKDLTNNFSLAFESDKSSEVTQNNSRLSKTPVKRKSIEEDLNTSISKKQKTDNSEELNENSESLTLKNPRSVNRTEKNLTTISEENKNESSHHSKSFGNVRLLSNNSIHDLNDCSRNLVVRLTNVENMIENGSLKIRTPEKSQNQNHSVHDETDKLSRTSRWILENPTNLDLSEPTDSEIQQNHVTTRNGSRLTAVSNKSQTQNKSPADKTMDKTKNKTQNGVETESVKQKSPRKSKSTNKSSNISNVSQNATDQQLESEIQQSHVTTRNGSQLTVASNKSKTLNKSSANKTVDKTLDKTKDKIDNKIETETVKQKSPRKSKSTRQSSNVSNTSLNATDQQLESEIQQSHVTTRNGSRLTAVSNKSQTQNKSSADKTNNKTVNEVETESVKQKSPRKSKSTRQSSNISNASLNATDQQLESEIQQSHVTTRNGSRVTAVSNESQTQNKSSADKTTDKTRNKTQNEVETESAKRKSPRKSNSTDKSSNIFNASPNATNQQLVSQTEQSHVTLRNGSQLTLPSNKSKIQNKSSADKTMNKTESNVESVSTKQKTSRKSKATINNTTINNSNIDDSISSINQQVLYEVQSSKETSRSNQNPKKSQSQNKTAKKKLLSQSHNEMNDISIQDTPKSQKINQSIISEKSIRKSNVSKKLNKESLTNGKIDEMFKKQSTLSRGKENRVDNNLDGALESDGAFSTYSHAYSDDLLGTPHPAQSTLMINGKPLSRLTVFNSRQSLFNRLQDTPPASSRGSSVNGKTTNVEVPLQITRVEVTPNKEASDPLPPPPPPPLQKTKTFRDYLESDRSAIMDETRHSNKSLLNRSSRSRTNENMSKFSEEQWEEAQRKIQRMTRKLEEKEKREKEIKLEEKRKIEKSQAELWRRIFQADKKKKTKPKKPVDKAFLVNGKVYKQPRLPQPQKWATDRLYNFLWKCMEPKYKLRTRIKSEKFVNKLSEYYKVIVKRKKYENYRAELEDILEMMAKYRIIKDRYDFYRFCSDFMPYNFRYKVVPMMLPGNRRNIPFEPELVHKPILENGSGCDSSDEEDQIQTNVECSESDNESESESDF